MPHACRPLPFLALAGLSLVAAMPALAQGTAPSRPATEQVIVPQVERREVNRPRFPSRDFAVGLYGGVYAVQNFGTSGVGGLRLAYHITEDFFVDATLGQSKVSDEAYRVGRPGGILATPSAPLRYYNVSAGYNLLPGEVFFGRNLAKAMQGYIVAGIGSTGYADQKWQTFSLGFGLRLIVKDWFALQADVRDHVFSNDLLGKRQSTQNPEITLGMSFYF